MSDPSTSEQATTLWLSYASDEPRLKEGALAVAQTLAHADRVLTALDAGLRRSLGAEGYAALLRRATSIAASAHPALSAIPELEVETLAASNGRVYRSDEIADGVVMLLSTLASLMARIIGVPMTARLLSQIAVPSPRGVVSITSRDASHG